MKPSKYKKFSLNKVLVLKEKEIKLLQLTPAVSSSSLRCYSIHSWILTSVLKTFFREMWTSQSVWKWTVKRFFCFDLNFLITRNGSMWWYFNRIAHNFKFPNFNFNNIVTRNPHSTFVIVMWSKRQDVVQILLFIRSITPYALKYFIPIFTFQPLEVKISRSFYPLLTC